MGKMKVHELAKELGMPSKDLVDKLISMKYDIKNHMSTLEDSDIEKIKKQFNSSKKDSADSFRKAKKAPMSPVIIRREVTRIETVDDHVVKPVKRSDDGLGVVQRRSDVSMNIKYRTPPRKIGSITPQKPQVQEASKSAEVVKKETIVAPANNNLKVNTEKVQAQEVGNNKNESLDKVVSQAMPVKENVKNETNPKREEERTVMREEKKDFNRDRNKNFDNRKQFNRDNNNRDYNNRDNNRNMNRDNRDNRDNNGNRRFDGNKRFDNKDGKRFDNKDGKKFDGNKKNNFQRNNNPVNKVEKEIQGIISNTEEQQKESAREGVRTAYKDKEKDNRKFEESSKKNTKSKNQRGSREEINMGKLKDLQSESKLSHMFDDTDSKMFDYYDLSKSNRGHKKTKKKHLESKDHIEQKIFELTEIEIADTVTVKDLAEKLKKQASEVIKKLMGYGIMATLNNELDFDTAYLVASEFGVDRKSVV